ncbi:hypothetical protein V438_02590 [Clostridioides difficile]|nr:hypothetical protein V439_05945 [Clostridioides difficile]PCN58735.1 hypothetical protein V438_02590 [Clostridioides difficile]
MDNYKSCEKVWINLPHFFYRAKEGDNYEIR